MINELLVVLSKSIDLFPNYEQRKKERFYKIRKGLLEELAKDEEYMDSSVIDELYDELCEFIKAFAKEIQG